MRIKLRLYPPDLDLLALKQTPGFNLGNAIRQALYEYVESGECSRIHVKYDPNVSITLRHDQINISFTKDEYQKVTEWISNIRPGLRNCAIKAVIRSAIANPALFIFAENSKLIMNDVRTSKTTRSESGGKSAEQASATNTFPSSLVSPFAQTPATTSPWSNTSKHFTDNSDDADIWSMDIENY